LFTTQALPPRCELSSCSASNLFGQSSQTYAGNADGSANEACKRRGTRSLPPSAVTKVIWRLSHCNALMMQRELTSTLKGPVS
jgi:hypothetical protein